MVKWIPVYVALNRAFRAERKRDLLELEELFPEQMDDLWWARLGR